MRKLSQRDPKWGNEYIGKSKEKVKDYGCTITSVSMFSDWYGGYKDPAWMADHLSFTTDGKLYWNSISTSVLPMRFVYRFYYKDDKKIQEILKSKDGVCLLEVNRNHWVALVGYSRIYGYRVHDPYYGDTIYLSKRNYKITGFTELTRK